MLLNYRQTNYFWRFWLDFDHILLSCLILLYLIGLCMIFSASPNVAIKLNLEPYFFFKRQALFTIIALFGLTFFLILPKNLLVKFAILALLIGIFGLFFLLNAEELKGAKRWINLFGFSFQP